MSLVFEKANCDEIDSVFTLYKKRVAWMDEAGIRQWNVTDYLGAYPKSYYEEQLHNDNLFVLREDCQIIGAVVLLQNDDRWSDKAKASAYYIHNLVTEPAYKGAGKIILEEAAKLALCNNKQYIRLDCAVDNRFLNEYYESLGYHFAGNCEDGPYKGNRREKVLVQLNNPEATGGHKLQKI